MTKREKEVLNGTIDILKQYLDPEKIILFGSRAQQKKNSKNSDFDLAVDKKKVDRKLKRKIIEEIEKVAGLYSVDIIFLPSIEKSFKDIILKTGFVV